MFLLSYIQSNLFLSAAGKMF